MAWTLESFLDKRICILVCDADFENELKFYFVVLWKIINISFDFT